MSTRATIALVLFVIWENIVDSIVNLVGAVGFPIVACVAMGVFIATSFKDFNNLLLKNNMLTDELIALLRKSSDDKDNAHA